MAAEQGCYTCRYVHERIVGSDVVGGHLEACLSPPVGFPKGWLKLSIELMGHGEGSHEDEDDSHDTEPTECNNRDSDNTNDPELAGEFLDAWGFMIAPAEGKLLRSSARSDTTIDF